MMGFTKEQLERINAVNSETKELLGKAIGLNWFKLKQMDESERNQLWEATKIEIDALPTDFMHVFEVKARSNPENMNKKIVSDGVVYRYVFSRNGFCCELEASIPDDSMKAVKARYYAYNNNDVFIKNLTKKS